MIGKGIVDFVQNAMLGNGVWIIEDTWVLNWCAVGAREGTV